MELIPGKLYRIKHPYFILYREIQSYSRQDNEIIFSAEGVDIITKDDIILYVKGEEGRIFVLFHDKVGWCDILTSIEDMIADLDVHDTRH